MDQRANGYHSAIPAQARGHVPELPETQTGGNPIPARALLQAPFRVRLFDHGTGSVRERRRRGHPRAFAGGKAEPALPRREGILPDGKDPSGRLTSLALNGQGAPSSSGAVPARYG